MNLPISQFSEKLLQIQLIEEVNAGEIIQIDVTSSFKTTIVMEVIDNSGTIIKEMTCNTTKEFICQTFWQTPKDTIPGTYTLKAEDGTNFDEIEFVIRN